MEKTHDILGMGTMIYGYFCHASDKTIRDLGLVPGQHTAVQYPLGDFERMLAKMDDVVCNYPLSSITNVLIANALCGGKPKYIGFAPPSTEANEFRALLEKAGVETQLVISDAVPLRKGIAAIAPNKEAAYLIFAENKQTPREIVKLEDAIAHAEYLLVHTTHLFEPEDSPGFRPYQIAKEHQTKIIADLGWSSPPSEDIDLERRLALCDILLGTELEFDRYTIAIQQRRELDLLGKHYLKYAPLVIIKKGANGVDIGWRMSMSRPYPGGFGVNSLRLPAFPVENVLHLSGAGDAFAGAFLAEMKEHGLFDTGSINFVRDTLLECAVVGCLAASHLIAHTKPFLDETFLEQLLEVRAARNI